MEDFLQKLNFKGEIHRIFALDGASSQNILCICFHNIKIQKHKKNKKKFYDRFSFAFQNKKCQM
jgi:hypothetical protein